MVNAASAFVQIRRSRSTTLDTRPTSSMAAMDELEGVVAAYNGADEDLLGKRAAMGVCSLALGAEGNDIVIDQRRLEELFVKYSQLSHKVYSRSEEAADQLKDLIGTPDDEMFRLMFKRVLQDGNWFGAADKGELAKTIRQGQEYLGQVKPWAVLVTGLNGIRKTTTINMPWFKEVLQDSLRGQVSDDMLESLPTGT